MDKSSNLHIHFQDDLLKMLTRKNCQSVNSVGRPECRRHLCRAVSKYVTHFACAEQLYSAKGHILKMLIVGRRNCQKRRTSETLCVVFRCHYAGDFGDDLALLILKRRNVFWVVRMPSPLRVTPQNAHLSVEESAKSVELLKRFPLYSVAIAWVTLARAKVFWAIRMPSPFVSLGVFKMSCTLFVLFQLNSDELDHIRFNNTEGDEFEL
ncbi:hypothetical protein niasHT_029554 [Heterodera trifolii]|uniref:Uncharacterized protein n=1 Tax=Heterodera trifolii TaxID=157864 RepID=A0ABD2JB12_9BILA